MLEYPNLLKINPNLSVFVSGNSFASISYLDQKEDYTNQQLNLKHKEGLKELVRHDAIDFILMRGDENSYVLANKDGESIIKIHHNQLSYHPDTTDVLSIGELDKPMNFTNSFEKTFNSDYPDALWQCHQLMQSHRAGDVIISAASGYDLRDFWEYPEHKGSHGSLHWEHMHVPILTNQKDHISSPVRTTEIHRIIKNWID